MRFWFFLFLICVLPSCTSSCQTHPSGVVKAQNAKETPVAKNDEKPKSYDEPITYLEAVSGANGVTVSLRSELELFCEQVCSKFELVEDTKDGVLTYKALRTPIRGNVQPSRLMEERRPNDKNINKIIVKNVGKNGSDLVLNDVMINGRTHFFAVSATIAPMMAIGGESTGFSIAFEGNKMDAAIDDQKLAATAASGKTFSGFVTGYVVTQSKIERGDVNVFHILTFEPGP